MEKRKPGRPKSKKPTLNIAITFRLTEEEFERAKKVAIDNDITNADIFLKGVDYWSDKK